MADNQYKILLGTKLDTSDIQDQVTAASKSIKPIELKIDAETKELTNTIKEALNTLSKGTKNALTLDTSKLEASLNDVTSTIREIKTAIGTLDSGSNMKSLVSSINQISTALDKASNKFDGLIGDLKALSGKDFSLNFGINLGGSNSVARQGVYGSHVRSETLPELKKQAKALQDYFKEYYNVQDELSAIMKLAPNRGGDIVDLYSPMSGYKSKTEKESLSKQMGAYREYINIIREAASLRGIDISHITSSFSKSADQLVQDAQDIQTGAKEMDESFDKLKQIFGGGNNISIEGLSASLEPIVADLNQIREAVVNLSKGVSLEGLTSSFDRLSASIENLLANAERVKGVLNSNLGNSAIGGTSTVNTTPIKSAQQVGREIGETVTKAAQQSLNIDDVINKQVLDLMDKFAIAGGKGSDAFNSIKQALIECRSELNILKNSDISIDEEVFDTSRAIDKVTDAIANQHRAANNLGKEYVELANYMMRFNDSSKGNKVRLPDFVKQEQGDDYSRNRGSLGIAFNTERGISFVDFINDLNHELGDTISLTNGEAAAMDELLRKVEIGRQQRDALKRSENYRTSTASTEEILEQNGINREEIYDGTMIAINAINDAEQKAAQSSTETANTVSQNEEKKQRAYQETSGVIENLKAALQTMRLDRSSIDAIIKDVEELGFTAKDASVAMKNGNFDITVNGIDNIGRAITEIRHLDSATGEITGISRKVSQSLTETDKFVKQQKRAVTDLTNQINQINRAATDQNANRPIKDSSHLDSLKSKYQEIIAAIQKMGNASSATFDDERNEVKRLISEYKSLKSEFKNAENVSMDFKGADFASGLEIAKNRLREFKADAKGFSQITQTVEQLDRAIEDVGDKSSLDKFNDQLRVAKSELKAVKAEVSSDNGSLAAKIRIDIETEKFDNKVSQLHNQLDQLTDVDGSLDKLRVSIKQVDDAYDAMTKATDDESLIQAQKRFAAAVEKTNNELKIQAREQRAANNAAKLADSKAALKTDMLNWLQKNSKATKEYKAEIDRLIASLDKLDQAGVNGVRRKFKNIDRDAELKGLKGLNFLESMKSKIKEYSVYFGAAEMFMYAEQGLRDMFEQVKLIDSAMTELKKVTNETDAAYDEFLTNAADRAKAIGTTIDGLVNSTADFARLGYGFKDAQGLAEVANIYAVVGDEIDGVEGATESLISTMAAFKGEMNGMSDTDFAMSIIDKFNEIGNNFAISSGGIGEALERSASSLMAANNTIDESIALITAANTVVGFVPPNIVIY